LRTQLYLAVDVGIIDEAKGNELLETTRKISGMLHNYIRVRIEKF
jgi:uncharacterized protein YlaN (UPF0358 family)